MIKPTIRSDYHTVFTQNSPINHEHQIFSVFKAIVLISLGFVLGMMYQKNVSKQPINVAGAAEVLDMTREVAKA